MFIEKKVTLDLFIKMHKEKYINSENKTKIRKFLFLGLNEIEKKYSNIGLLSLQSNIGDDITILYHQMAKML